MKLRRKILLIPAALLLACAVWFFFFVSDYYPAQGDPVTALAAEDSIALTVVDNFIFLTPEEPNGIGLVFYPGGRVEHTAYLPLLEKLCARGVTCALAEVPLRLAFFSPFAAKNALVWQPELDWYIGGHSLGGVMACFCAAEHPESFSGVILLGAYPFGDWPIEKTLTLYGSEDGILNRAKITYTENVTVLEGGNHAQFGSYGPQKGDGTAALSPEEQQSLTAQLILDFMGGE